MIDINEIRDPDIRLHGLSNVDDLYTFYYDETNNIRRLHITPEGLNVREPRCFVLGGIAHKGPVRELAVETLRSALKIQKSAIEIKLKHLGKGDFLDLLGSTKVEAFLNWLLEEGLFVHYQALDVMYWSIVDILDSMITEIGHTPLIMIAPALKDDLYTILRHDFDGTVDLFKRYAYPNVDRNLRAAFIGELTQLLDARRRLLPDFNFQMLKGVLEMAVSLNSLPYLEDEVPNVLIDGFGMFYIKRICLFKNSTHILDIEEVIERRLASEAFVDHGLLVQNYRFADSKQEVGIQVADVAVGLLGKAFTFLNRTSMDGLQTAKETLSQNQVRNLKLLARLIDFSISKNAAFGHYVLSREDQRRMAFFLHGA